ncbi:hypothetical protein ACH42_13735 [Endozoicomonas sp. (ex Bugula neritina AB1)]|nr:hypothetical protein ACH42_13735 [Endozoicomonas sp. (ex Bugula neritina AB1)]
MLFALRDDKQTIIAVSERKLNDDWVAVELEDEDVRSFLQENPEISERVMQAQDADFIRVLEDVIDLLLDKQVIQFTELPNPVQTKLLNRRRYRETMRELSDTTQLLEGDDGIF